MNDNDEFLWSSNYVTADITEFYTAFFDCLAHLKLTAKR